MLQVFETTKQNKSVEFINREFVTGNGRYLIQLETENNPGVVVPGWRAGSPRSFDFLKKPRLSTGVAPMGLGAINLNLPKNTNIV